MTGRNPLRPARLEKHAMTTTLIAASDNHDPANVFARCRCVDPDTGARLGRRCPQLGQPGHGSWYFAAELPAQAGKRQRLPHPHPGRAGPGRAAGRTPRARRRPGVDVGAVAEPVAAGHAGLPAADHSGRLSQTRPAAPGPDARPRKTTINSAWVTARPRQTRSPGRRQPRPDGRRQPSTTAMGRTIRMASNRRTKL